MEDKQMRFTHGVFNIDLQLQDLSENGNAGEYNTTDQTIYIDYQYIKSVIEDKGHFVKELRRIIIHELTHFFDFNCWKSWSYKEDNPHEHLATFNETFVEPIVQFTDSMLAWMLKQDKDMKKWAEEAYK
jgi:hypothetical protein